MKNLTPFPLKIAAVKSPPYQRRYLLIMHLSYLEEFGIPRCASGFHPHKSSLKTLTYSTIFEFIVHLLFVILYFFNSEFLSSSRIVIFLSLHWPSYFFILCLFDFIAYISQPSRSVLAMLNVNIKSLYYSILCCNEI